MPFTITNKRDNSTFVVNDGETILDAALRNNRVLPYGCRNGVCGACKCALLGGQVDYGTYEDFALTDDEKQAGKLLLCQAKPLEDVEIDVEEIMTGVNIQIKMLPCRVARLDRIAQDVMRVFLMLPKTQTFNFMAGQYIDIVLKDGQRRSFSIANLPQDTAGEGLEVHIRLVPDGHFTPKVFEALRVRDLLRLEGPFGNYLLRSEVTTPLLMIAGGTGFAPIKCLFEQIQENSPGQKVHLFWGARNQQDLYLNDQIQKWTLEYPDLVYTPVLSDSWPDSWDGETGYVHDAVCRHYADVSAYDVYASGPPIMVDSLRRSLTGRGLKLDRFFFDSFEFAPHA